MTLEDLCFEVCTALDAVDTRVVLTGGSAATFYAPQTYQSYDADFIIVFGNFDGVAGKALENLGFINRNGMYHREGTKYTLEFPAGPLAIGSDYITDYATVRRGGQVLYVLHPIDCVRDRLMWYYVDSDFSALKAAIGVAQAHAVDMETIRHWSERERFQEKFAFFKGHIAKAHGSKTKALP